MKTLAEIEKQTILERLAEFNGNKTQAAKSLGITLKTIYNKLDKYAQEVECTAPQEALRVETDVTE